MINKQTNKNNASILSKRKQVNENKSLLVSVLFQSPKSKYSYYILRVTTKKKYKLCCFQTSKMSMQTYVLGEYSENINNTQSVQKNIGNMDTGIHGEKKTQGKQKSQNCRK